MPSAMLGLVSSHYATSQHFRLSSFCGSQSLSCPPRIKRHRYFEWFMKFHTEHDPVESLSIHQLPAQTHRRAFIRHFMKFATVAVLGANIGVVRPPIVRADRTGKYSTKLTAKRRYIPRIVSGFESLRNLGTGITESGWTASDEWIAQARLFLDGPAADMKSAMPLFASSYFSDGNKIGPVERKLKEIETEFFAAFNDIREAINSNNSSNTVSAYQRAVERGNEYIETAKLSTDIPLL